MPDRRLRAAALAGAALAALAARPAPAQSAPGLTLEAVVRRAAAENPQMRMVRARVDAVYGRALAASGPFDTWLGASVAGTQQSAYQAGTAGLVAATTQQTEYALQGQRRLRSGIVLQPRVSVTRTTEEGIPAVDAASSVSLGMTLPLLRDRFGRESASGERGLRFRAQAGPHDVRYATDAGVSAAVNAYWDYAAACARLDVYAQAEDRARRRLEETRALVAGDERPASDLSPLEAASARARQQRVAAEQGVDEARVQLGIALGMDPAETLALPAPATAFPEPGTPIPGPEEEARLVRLALASRGDYVGTELELASDEVLLQGAREALKPQLDLQLSVGYTGRQLGSGYGGLVQPLYRDVPGLNASLQLQYQFSPTRAEARGAAAQAQAARDEKAVAVQDLARQVAGNVAVSVRGLRRGVEALAAADSAVAQYRATVEAEQTKNRLGAATLFDVTYAEDNLTSAQLTAVNARAIYAKMLAQLRVVTGTLAVDGDGGPVVDPARLLTTP